MPTRDRVDDAHSDADLVRQTLAGHSAAYGDLVRRWATRVVALCHAQARSADAADDLAQETLLRGLDGLSSLQQPERFGAWLCGIARRVCLDWIDRRRVQRAAVADVGMDADELEAGMEADDPADESELLMDSCELMRAVESLPQPYRETVMLYYYDDVTYAELAETLGVSSAAINARLTKARAMLRNRLSAVRRRA